MSEQAPDNRVALRPSRISVIMNCYNSARFLRAAIDSVFAQTYTDWEIVFWDNQSTDDSAAIFKSYVDPRCRYFLAPVHTGLGQARNLAVAQARGEWCAFLDCDDIWLSDKLTKQVAIINEGGPELGLVYGQMTVLMEESGSATAWGRSQKKFSTRSRLRKLPEGDIFAELLKSDFIPLPSAVVRRVAYWAVDGIDARFRYAEDFDLFVKIAKIYSVRAVQEVVCGYRIHDRNSSNPLGDVGFNENLSVVSRYLPLPAAKNAMKYQYTHHAVRFFRARRLAEGVKMLLSRGDLRVLIKEFATRLLAR